MKRATLLLKVQFGGIKAHVCAAVTSRRLSLSQAGSVSLLKTDTVSSLTCHCTYEFGCPKAPHRSAVIASACCD